MPILAPTWKIPLSFKPQLLQSAVAVQGSRHVERVRLAELWCLHLHRYEGDLLIDGRPFAIRPGYASVTPPGVKLEYHYRGRSVHAYAHFVLPDLRDGAVEIPIVQDLGSDFDAINQRLEEAIAFFPTQPRRAEVRVWDVLWDLASRVARAGTSDLAVGAAAHPAFDRARKLIELRLAEPIRVAALAREAGISHNHMTRLFRSQTGHTVAGYIRDRRVQRARHLLSHSTAPVKTIAADVGIPDLHLFNKVMRRSLGASPRRLRGN